MHSSYPETRASLILRLQDSDDIAAWDEFAAIYTPVLFRVALKRGFQRADAENLVQEVLLAVARSISPWLERADRGRFRPWLLRIARNASYDLFTARATRQLGKDGEEGERILAELPDRNSLTSALDLEHEREVFLWAANQVRSSVADRTWQAFWLTQIDGMAPEQASEKLGMRVANIYIARCRIMARIKELVTHFEGAFSR